MKVCSPVFPFLDDYSFPANLTDGLVVALAPARLAVIRNDIEAGGRDFIRVNVGMMEGAMEEPVDWLSSHSVLEHVDDLAGVFRFLEHSLKPDGVMTHLIDFSAHGLSDDWNGHWAMSEFRWRLLRGRRLYLLNRQPLETYLDLFERHGMRVVAKRLHQRVDGLLATDFQPSFSQVSSTDARTHMAFLVCMRQQDRVPCRDAGAAAETSNQALSQPVLRVNFRQSGTRSCLH
jgi:hypothetical protein